MIFKGGNLTLKSGGIGPDHYIFRSTQSRTHPWTAVTLRTDSWANYNQDKLALSFILSQLKTY